MKPKYLRTFGGPQPNARYLVVSAIEDNGKTYFVCRRTNEKGMLDINVLRKDGSTYTVTPGTNKYGLAVCHHTGESGKGWGVVHTPSGQWVGSPELKTRQAARSLREALLRLRFDWTRGYYELKTFLKHDSTPGKLWKQYAQGETV